MFTLKEAEYGNIIFNTVVQIFRVCSLWYFKPTYQISIL